MFSNMFSVFNINTYYLIFVPIPKVILYVIGIHLESVVGFVSNWAYLFICLSVCIPAY